MVDKMNTKTLIDELRKAARMTDMPNLLLEAADKLEEMEWIPVSERLPEKSGYYLVTYEKSDGTRRVDIDHYWTGIQMQDGRYRAEWHDAELTYCKVISWMPLPEPYKERRV